MASTPNDSTPDKRNTGNSGADRSSAPELPHEVAKEYGLHHERGHGRAEAAVGAVGGTSDSDQAPVAGSADAADSDRNDGNHSDKTPSAVDDPKTEAAVDDIVAKESDELLDMQDGVVPASAAQPVRRGFWRGLGHFFVRWWRNKWARWITIVVLLAAITATAAVPKMRYAVLNAAGVRSTASLTVVDTATQLPLKNVTVTLGGTKVQTDVNGVARLSKLKLGPYKLEVQRIAFAPYSRQVNIGWGSNPLGLYKLQAVGTQYIIMVTDFLSGKPIEGAEAESDQGNALADKTGKVSLAIDDTDVTKLTIKIRADGYRAEDATLDAATKTTINQPLVPDQKTVYVSKESGKYDVFSSDLDGKNKRLLLAGTGMENKSIGLVVSPDNTQAALISQRENTRDADGYLLYSLTFINIAEGTTSIIDRAQQIQPVDWIGSRFIYRSTIAGASAANAQRNRLISYNYGSNARIQLATANQFNVAMGAKGQIYFAASSTDPRATLGLFRIKPDGSSRERLSEQEVWTGLRTTYSNLSLQTPDGWYGHTLGTREVTKAGAPANFANYSFVDNQTGTANAWIDTRDGKGVLLLQNASDGQNTTLATVAGLTYPLHWAGPRALVYRISISGGTADYAISPDSGNPVKVGDVAPTYGFAQNY